MRSVPLVRPVPLVPLVPLVPREPLVPLDGPSGGNPPLDLLLRVSTMLCVKLYCRDADRATVKVLRVVLLCGVIMCTMQAGIIPRVQR